MAGLRSGEPTRALHAEWPFGGRRDEVDLITSTLGSEQSGPSGAVVVAAAGVGKTRLTREVGHWAKGRGMRTATIIATEAGRLTPYGAVLHLLPPGSGTPAEHAGWHASFAQALGSGPRMVLLVDDAQHLDDGSAALLLQLSLDGIIAPVISVRRGEQVPDAITSLWKEGLALRVDLQPLSEKEMGEVIAGALGGLTTGRTLSRLASVSGGNMLYARELVIAALDHGSLNQEDGVWVWDEEVVLAPRLIDAVGARLATLDPEERRALALVALGEPMPLSVAERVAPITVLGSLEESGLVRLDGRFGHGVLRPAHPLYGEVVLERVGRIGRRGLVAALADAFETVDPADAEAVSIRVVTWRLDAGQQVPRADLVDAAVRANQAFGHDVAARLARAALAASEDDDSLDRARVVIELGRALVGSNEVEEAERLLADLEDFVIELPDSPLVDDYVDVRYRATGLGLGRIEDVVALLDRIEEAPRTEGPSRDIADRRDRLAPYRASIAISAGHPKEALTLVEPLLERSSLAPAQQLVVLETAGEALGQLGLHRRAATVWDRMRSFPVGVMGPSSRVTAEADMQALFAAMLDGRVADVLPVFIAHHSEVAHSPDAIMRGLAGLGLGRCLILSGRLEEARTVLLDALADFRESDLADCLTWALTLLSQTASLSQRVEAARAWREEASAEQQFVDLPRQAVDHLSARVWLVAAEGSRTAAAALARDGADRYPELELDRASLLHLAVRLGERSREVATTLRQIAGRAECDYPTLLADHADALRANDGAALEDVAERFATRGLAHLAVETAHASTQAYREAGAAHGTRRMTARTDTLALRVDPVLRPEMTTTHPAVRLSRREQEVAALAVAGLSNSAIADRLVLSVRTVESHLYQVFAKLGVTSRGELERYLPRAWSGGVHNRAQ
ncbi:hypothetical protein ASG73_04800 [Janibacter sp. Soil728]|uniref:helix-turn-helix transcriptional regulator n=1 Tax=Janibacter sp. Soil728 TaxID=1736393 RepID=UPI0006FFEE80|nr:LuxR family transcriptional regulator [Janibacter sp. Soil728]KRE38280.1 hypothetical protein ASG73_04800 [Janibacter sp. Soil728]